MLKPLSDPDAVLDYVREEAQAGAEQAKVLRALAIQRMMATETITDAMLESFACAVHVHTIYLRVLQATVTMPDPVDYEDE